MLELVLGFQELVEEPMRPLPVEAVPGRACMGVYDENVDDALIVVYQASGMTMEYLDCSSPEAFLALIALAAETDRTLSDVASDVVERRIRLGGR